MNKRSLLLLIALFSATALYGMEKQQAPESEPLSVRISRLIVDHPIKIGAIATISSETIAEILAKKRYGRFRECDPSNKEKFGNWVVGGIGFGFVLSHIAWVCAKNKVAAADAAIAAREVAKKTAEIAAQVAAQVKKNEYTLTDFFEDTYFSQDLS